MQIGFVRVGGYIRVMVFRGRHLLQKSGIAILLIPSCDARWVEPTKFRILNPNVIDPHTDEMIRINDKNRCQKCCINGKTDFIASELNYVNLSGAKLVQTEFVYAKINFACFKGADIRFARFEYTVGAGANFSDVNALGVQFVGAMLSQANFFQANLVESSFDQAICNDANFSGADLSFSNLKNGKFMQADFSGGDLSGVDFTGSDLTCANLSGATITCETKFKRANLRGALVDVCELKKARFEDTIMPDGKLYSN